jgi:hypothetical protein
LAAFTLTLGRASSAPDGEDAARELPSLSLRDARQVVHLYAERGSPKDEKAAMRWLERCLTDGSPGLGHFAEVTAGLAKLGSQDR